MSVTNVQLQDTPPEKPKDPKATKARVTQLNPEQKEKLSQMATPQCMEASERKRQYAAMGRAIHKLSRVATLHCLQSTPFVRTLRGLWGSGAELILFRFFPC